MTDTHESAGPAAPGTPGTPGTSAPIPAEPPSDDPGGTRRSPLTDLHGLALAAQPRAKRPGVKRVLVAEGARVVVFRFAAQQILAEHKAAFPILVQSIDGHIRFTADGRTIDLHPGDLAHLPARVLHEVHAVTDATLLLTMLDPDASPDEA